MCVLTIRIPAPECLQPGCHCTMMNTYISGPLTLTGSKMLIQRNMIFVNSASADDLTPNLGILLAYHNQILLLVGYQKNVANESEGSS